MRAVPSLAFAALAGILLAGCFGGSTTTTTSGSTTTGAPPATGVDLAWGAPVDLKAIGYEPSLACDSTGALYITAHKDLQRPDTWPYLASWILVSTDHGATWHAPASPGNVASLFVGDEGDLAVDARDWLYYVDTYLADTHLHVWSEQGATWKYSVPGRSTQADDRPWIFAQGDGIVHYLGNNGATVPGERYIYYRSADAGLTWSTGTGLPFAGWAHGEAQRNGTWAYLVQEEAAGGPTDMAVLASSDSGATWGAPVVMGHRSGNGGDGAYPIVAVDGVGNPAAIWVDVHGSGSNVTLARSFDHGATWNTTDITPHKGYFDHVTLNAVGNGTLGVAFYGTNETSPKATSEWHLYAGMASDPSGQARTAADFGLHVVDPKPLYTGADLHALHDFFEVCIDPQMALNVAYMTNLPGTAPNQTDGDRQLWFVRGVQQPTTQA